jgi:glutathione S-transferase
MIKLYGAGPSRWVKCYWTLRELDVPFESVSVSVLKGETRTPEFLAKNPFGKLSVMEDAGFRLRESSAICTYLAEKHPDKGLLPKAGSRERALVNQWMSFAVGASSPHARTVGGRPVRGAAGPDGRDSSWVRKGWSSTARLDT